MIFLVFGTRPEAIKLGPVANELRNLQVPFEIIATGQHEDLLKGTPAENDLMPDMTFLMPEGEDRVDVVAGYIANHLSGQEDIVVVQGDTASALAGARAASRAWARLAHVEAGIRSGDIENPWPEEIYRREISRLADIHFAPTMLCVRNLKNEDITENVWMTGNPIVSALHRYATGKAGPPGPYILMTMHRREFLNRGDTLDLWNTVQDWTDSELAIKVVWLVHPSLREKVGSMRVYRNFIPSPPLSYKLTQGFLRRCLGVITDSGGLTEEAVTLGVPVGVLRYVNDRSEAEATNLCRRFDPTSVGFREAANWLRIAPQSRLPLSTFGKADAALKIARHLQRLGRQDHAGPTQEGHPRTV